MPLRAKRLILAFLLPITLLSARRCPAQDAPARHFRMGFTGFPHDFTAEAVRESHEFSRRNADIIAHHIEGVP